MLENLDLFPADGLAGLGAPELLLFLRLLHHLQYLRDPHQLQLRGRACCVVVGQQDLQLRFRFLLLA